LFADLIDEVIEQYLLNPRNKLYLSEDVLLASAIEESGVEVTARNLRESV